jgi:hypothetical protein
LRTCCQLMKRQPFSSEAVRTVSNRFLLLKVTLSQKPEVNNYLQPTQLDFYWNMCLSQLICTLLWYLHGVCIYFIYLFISYSRRPRTWPNMHTKFTPGPNLNQINSVHTLIFCSSHIHFLLFLTDSQFSQVASFTEISLQKCCIHLSFPLWIIYVPFIKTSLINFRNKNIRYRWSTNLKAPSILRDVFLILHFTKISSVTLLWFQITGAKYAGVSWKEW